MVLKVRMLQAEVREVLLYGCSTWTLLTREYGLLRTQHHRLLLRRVGFRKSQRSDHPLSYAVTRGNDYSTTIHGSNRHRRGQPEKSWWNSLTDDLKALEISEGEWEMLAKDRISWCGRVSQGAEVFMSA